MQVITLTNFYSWINEKNIIVMNDKPHKIETPNSIHMWPVPQDFDAVEPLADAEAEQE